MALPDRDIVDAFTDYRDFMVIKQIRPAIAAFVLFSVLLGIIYPTLITLIAQVLFPSQANGSVIFHNGRARGSELIGQEFTSLEYFWGRPSATSGSPYTSFDPNNLTGSSGSNLGPLSKTLIDEIQNRYLLLKSANPNSSGKIPIDLLTASGSGLDPDISLESAYFQVPRIAQSRGLYESDVAKVIDTHIENQILGYLGLSYVNVLKLNLALDDLQ